MACGALMTWSRAPLRVQKGPHTAQQSDPEATSFDSLFLGLCTAGCVKRGFIFWNPFWARPVEFIHCGVDSGATGRTQLFISGNFFCDSLGTPCAALRSHSCLGPSFRPGRLWSREPKCRDLAQGTPRAASPLGMAPKASGLAAEVQRQSPEPSSP